MYVNKLFSKLIGLICRYLRQVFFLWFELYQSCTKLFVKLYNRSRNKEKPQKLRLIYGLRFGAPSASLMPVGHS